MAACGWASEGEVGRRELYPPPDASVRLHVQAAGCRPGGESSSGTGSNHSRQRGGNMKANLSPYPNLLAYDRPRTWYCLPCHRTPYIRRSIAAAFRANHYHHHHDR